MMRLISTIKNDIIVQYRNNLYTIGIVISIIFAVMLSQLFNISQIISFIPPLMLMIVGGSTLMYVGVLILTEKDTGTMNAVIVSPVKTVEYLLSKVITFTILATMEIVIIIGGMILIRSFSEPIELPNILLLLSGILIINILYTLVGIAITVRYKKVADFMLLLVFIVIAMQIPILYFWDIVNSQIFLIIPSSAPIKIIQGAFVNIPLWEWIYAVSYSLILIIMASIWAYKSFNKHIILKAG